MSDGHQDIGRHLGRLFEVGFNAGLLHSMEHHQLPQRYGTFYADALAMLRLPRVIQAISKRERIRSDVDRRLIASWFRYFLLR